MLNNNSVSFGSKIKFQDFSTFLSKYCDSSIPRVRTDDCIEIGGKKGVSSVGSSSSVIYSVKFNDAKTKLYNYCCEPQKVVSDIVDFKKTPEKFFAIGGDVNYSLYPVERVPEIKSEQTPTTLFLGQDGGFINVLFDKVNDTYNVFVKNLDLKAGAEGLKKAFKVISVDNSDKVFVAGKQIPVEEINKNKFSFIV